MKKAEGRDLRRDFTRLHFSFLHGYSTERLSELGWIFVLVVTERLLLWRSNLLMTVWTPAKLSGTYAQAVTAPTCGLE